MRTFCVTVGHTIRFDQARSGVRTFSSQALRKSGSSVSVSEKDMGHSGQDRKIVGVSVPNGVRVDTITPTMSQQCWEFPSKRNDG